MIDLEGRIVKLLQDRGPMQFGQIQLVLGERRGVLDHALRRLKKDGVVGLEKIIGHNIFKWALTVRAVVSTSKDEPSPTL